MAQAQVRSRRDISIAISNGHPSSVTFRNRLIIAQRATMDGPSIKNTLGQYLVIFVGRLALIAIQV